MLIKPNIPTLLQTRGAPLAATFNLCFKQLLHQKLSLRTTDGDVSAARKWLAELNEASLPPNIGEVSYSRSSGPGGQNVNKFVSRLFSASSL